jgi:hypothetical protein
VMLDRVRDACCLLFAGSSVVPPRRSGRKSFSYAELSKSECSRFGPLR